MEEPMTSRLFFLLLPAAAFLACGGDDGSPSAEPDAASQDAVTGDATGDAPAPDGTPQDRSGQDREPVGDTQEPDQPTEWESYYHLTLDLEPGPAITCQDDAKVDCFEGLQCCRYQFDRDLTGLETKFSFGSTHIAPAISLAMTDTMYTPTFAVITLNFGIIVGTPDKPSATPKSGKYEFSVFEPEVLVNIYNKTYSSKEEGADGVVDVTDWSADQGGLFAGTFGGTIIQQTEKVDKLRGKVKGDFHFTLPEPQGR
jgi:hypothetical protein